ncbi:uncharacterized protein LOC105182112 [Harpegnathos saltator]|uniref:uncharacterized protein LOC105182112 n=1 Tax=Harpegnathos saltator TaxID=610380 RepID=UPI00058C0805|nr:uncharacterized protein LOC105182112 [Harpegnathos saltator]
MKTIVIIISVLAVMTVVYGYNEERSEKFLRNLSKCEKSPTRLQGDRLSLETVICAIENDGKIFNENGEYKFEAAMQGLEDAISDQNSLNKAKKTFTNCYNKEIEKKTTGMDQTKEITKCSLSIFSFFDKLK